MIEAFTGILITLVIIIGAVLSPFIIIATMYGIWQLGEAICSGIDYLLQLYSKSGTITKSTEIHKTTLTVAKPKPKQTLKADVVKEIIY